MEGSAEVGSEAWLDHVFVRDVKNDLFDGHRPRRNPILILLGGQPAAGKTRAQFAVTAEYRSEDLVEITGDDLREFHPAYRHLALEEPLAMPNETAPVSGGLVRRALEYGRSHRYSILLEGTFRDAAMVTATVRRFASAGYRVHVVAVSTPPAVSRLSAEERSLDRGYPHLGRWTPPSAHESALAEAANVVAALEALPRVSRMDVFSRSGRLYTNERGADGSWLISVACERVFREHQAQSLSAEDARLWLLRFAEAFAKAVGRPAYLGAETGSAYIRLQHDAQSMIDLLTETGNTPVMSFVQQQSERNDVLRQMLPADLLATLPLPGE